MRGSINFTVSDVAQLVQEPFVDPSGANENKVRPLRQRSEVQQYLPILSLLEGTTAAVPRVLRHLFLHHCSVLQRVRLLLARQLQC